MYREGLVKSLLTCRVSRGLLMKLLLFLMMGFLLSCQGKKSDSPLKEVSTKVLEEKKEKELGNKQVIKPSLVTPQDERQSKFRCEKNNVFLFRDKTKLRLTVKADFQHVNNAQSKKESETRGMAWFTGKESLKWNLKVSGRGNQRFSNCRFRPLKLNFSKKDKDLRWVKAGEKFKLVTHCNLSNRSDVEDTQAVYMEAFLYSIQNTFMRFSYRVRLAEITYLNNDGSLYDRGVSFFIEPAKNLAKRCYLKSLKNLSKIPIDPYKEYEKAVSLLSAPYNKFQKEFTEVFNLFIFNSDYLIPSDAYDSVHNLSQFYFPARHQKYILAYDLDQSAMVQAGLKSIDGGEYLISVSSEQHLDDLRKQINSSSYRKLILKQFKSKRRIIKRKIDKNLYLNKEKKSILYDWMRDVDFLIRD